MMKSAMLMLALICGAQSCSREDSTSNLNSNYPPDYAWDRVCHDTDEFRVCQRTNGGNRSELAIEYKGPLSRSGTLSMFVKLNGRDAVFLMENRGELQKLRLANGPFDCSWEQALRSWSCRSPEQKTLDLFYYAMRSYHIRNAWDVELAVVNEQGQWDSRFGANYKFRFEQ